MDIYGLLAIGWLQLMEECLHLEAKSCPPGGQGCGGRGGGREFGVLCENSARISYDALLVCHQAVACFCIPCPAMCS